MWYARSMHTRAACTFRVREAKEKDFDRRKNQPATHT